MRGSTALDPGIEVRERHKGRIDTQTSTRILVNKLIVDPKTLRETTTWSPAFKVARQVVRMAAIPDAVATHRVPPSRPARRSSKVRTVGLVKRE